jgi:hypothetical protein
MTESEWTMCDDPAKMLEYILQQGGNVSHKLASFASSCCQRIWYLLLEDRDKLLSPKKWELGWSPSLSGTLLELENHRAYVSESVEGFISAEREYGRGTVSQRELADRAIALAHIAWNDATSLADCVVKLEEGSPWTEAVRSCAIDFEMEGSSDVAPRDFVLYAAAALLFAAADAWSDLSKAVAEGQARYGAAAAWIVASQTNDMKAVRQAAQAAGAAERQRQCDQLRDLFPDLPQ